MRNLAPGELGGVRSKTEAEDQIDFFTEKFTGVKMEDLSDDDQLIAANLFIKKMTETFETSQNNIHQDIGGDMYNDEAFKGRVGVLTIREMWDGSALYISADSYPNYEKDDNLSPCTLSILEMKPDRIKGPVHIYSLSRDFKSVSRSDIYDIDERASIVNNVANFKATNTEEAIGYTEECSRHEQNQLLDEAERIAKINHQPVNVYEVEQAFELLLISVMENGFVPNSQLEKSRIASLDKNQFI